MLVTELRMLTSVAAVDVDLLSLCWLCASFATYVAEVKELLNIHNPAQEPASYPRMVDALEAVLEAVESVTKRGFDVQQQRGYPASELFTYANLEGLSCATFERKVAAVVQSGRFLLCGLSLQVVWRIRKAQQTW